MLRLWRTWSLGRQVSKQESSRDSGARTVKIIKNQKHNDDRDSQTTLPRIGAEVDDIIKAMLNDVLECRAILDSAASHTFITRHQLQRLKLRCPERIKEYEVPQRASWILDGIYMTVQSNHIRKGFC